MPGSIRILVDASILSATVAFGRWRHFQREHAEEEYTVTTQLPRAPDMRSPAAFGAIEGRVEAPSTGEGLCFTIYDVCYDQAIPCYFESDQLEIVQKALGKRVLVDGWVSRDPFTGRPTSIRRIRSVVVLGEVRPGSYLEAKGLLAAYADDVTPEDAIRQSRDSW